MQKNLKIIYLAGFLFSIPVALTSYINSTFLKSFVSEYTVSFIYVVASIVTILGLLKMPKILSRLGNRKATLYFSIICFFSLLILAFGKISALVIPAFVLFFVTTNFLIATLDIFIEDFSNNVSVGKFRGLYLMFINLAWVTSQAISGTVIAKSSFLGIYLLSALFMITVSSVFILFLHDFKDPKYTKVSILKTLKSFVRNKNIFKIYLLNLILKFFFVWMIVYTPIYLHEYLGFDWTKIGFIFTIMLLPFIFLTFPLGKLSDKIGEKKMLLMGFFIATIFTLLMPFIKTPIFLVWAGILFMTRVGAATIEIMTETYFFKIVTEENADEISFFRNTTPVSFLIAPLFAIPILMFTPSFAYIFFVLGAILLGGLFITLRLKDIK